MTSCSQRCRRTPLLMFRALKLSRCLCIWVKPFISCSEMKLLTGFQCPLMQNSSSALLVCWLSKYFFKCTSVFIFLVLRILAVCQSCLFQVGGFTACLTLLLSQGCWKILSCWCTYFKGFFFFFAFLKENPDLGLLEEIMRTKLSIYSPLGN